jgi:hypothetical protein
MVFFKQWRLHLNIIFFLLLFGSLYASSYSDCLTEISAIEIARSVSTAFQIQDILMHRKINNTVTPKIVLSGSESNKNQESDQKGKN